MKPITVISTDWHIEEGNIEQVLDLIDQKIKLAQSLNVKKLICLGDVFDSRKAQKQVVLNCFSEILDKIGQARMELHVIPGNHDKTDYTSKISFLSPFLYHPSLYLYSEAFLNKDLGFLFIPFFSEEIWIEKLKKVSKEKDLKNITLFSHIAVNGSVNNDGSKVESKINSSLLSPFKKVFLGHYHDAQQPFVNTYHLPSIKQKNFGENPEKGFTVLYDDGSTNFVKSKFKEFVTISIDSSNLDSETLNRIQEEDFSGVNVRVELSGTNEEIRSLNLNKLKSKGIKIKTKFSEIEEGILNAKNGKTLDFEQDSEILKAFEEFCNLKSLNKEEGIYFLKKLLNNG